ncbi:MAG: AMP-binding protein [Gammaproteobacteria bacterium]|nr:AMP-binding protein [Gammaproteobacteria bacterium]
MKEQLSKEFDPRQYTSLLDVLSYANKHYGDKSAYSCFSRTLSYSDLNRYSDNFALYLRSKTSLKTGDRIAIQLPNLLQFPIAMFGALKAGLVVVNTNPLYTAREMRHQFTDSGVKAIVILSNFCHKLEEVIEDTDIEHVIVTQIGDMQSPLKRLFMNLGIRHIKKLVPDYHLDDAADFQKIMSGSGDTTVQLPKPSREGDDTALILYTGGTTGYAKGAMLSHNNLLANMMQMRIRCMEIISDGVEDILAPLPLYHSYAFMFHCVLMPYAGNHNLLVTNPGDLGSVIDVLKNRRVTGFVGINTIYLALLQRDDIKGVDFSDMHFCGAGGMPMTKNVADDWEKLVGCKVFEGYGLTECSPVVSVNSPSKYREGTVGVPMAGTEVQVVDDEGKTLEHGEKGELWVRGPQVMQGYWNREENTQEVLSADGWLKTGDYVQIDEDGYIKVVDRKKDMILVSGFNVVPAEIEEYVNAHPDVLESAAIGVPNPKTGESVVLYLVAKKNSITQEELRAYCKKGLAGYKLPRKIIFRDELPKSNIGKVLRRELRDNHGSANQES